VAKCSSRAIVRIGRTPSTAKHVQGSIGLALIDA
jgi:hypothetical protein